MLTEFLRFHFLSFTAVRYGLVKDKDTKNKKKRAWADRYAERNVRNTYDEEDAEDEWGNPIPRTTSTESLPRGGAGGGSGGGGGARRRPSEVLSSDSNGLADDLGPKARDLERHGSFASSTSDDSRYADYRGDAPGSYDELPGGGERKLRGQKRSGLRKLLPGQHPAKEDRFARMEHERERAGTKRASDYGDLAYNNDPLGVSARPASQLVDPNSLEHQF
jgi:hypothetical protein